MKPWNERSGRMWSGSESIVSPAEGRNCAGPYRRRWWESRQWRATCPPKSAKSKDLTRPIGAGEGVAADLFDLAGTRGLGDTRKPRLLQLPIDPHGRLVGPADDGEPTQYACECNDRHWSSPVHPQPPRAFSPNRRRAAIGVLRQNGALTELSKAESRPDRAGFQRRNQLVRQATNAVRDIERSRPRRAAAEQT